VRLFVNCYLPRLWPFNVAYWDQREFTPQHAAYRESIITLLHVSWLLQADDHTRQLWLRSGAPAGNSPKQTESAGEKLKFDTLRFTGGSNTDSPVESIPGNTNLTMRAG
jgi:hypothetical protein